MIQTFKIFLASSDELKDDRQKFQLFIDNRNKSWVKKGVALELVHWEDFIDAVSKTRLQDEYNKAIRDCDLFLMLFFTKVGMYTDEEFETACECFKRTQKKPLIYTFFKNASITTGAANPKDFTSLWAFQEKLKDLGHFKTTYTSTEDFLLQFGQQLDKLADEGIIKLHTNNALSDSKHKIPHHLTPPPFIPEIFEGRTHDLEEVRRKLSEENSFLLLVNGEGGIGKTTLAAKYWQRYEPEYNHTAWLFAQKNLLDALLTLAAPLQIEFPKAMPPDKRLAVLLTAMANLENPCLLIIDNANAVQELEKHYLALRSCPNFHILLTTRINWFVHADIYHINPLQEDDALTVFKIHYPKHKTDEDELLKRIFSAVGRNTLVMELLAKNLAAINTDEVFYSLSDLHEDLQKKGLLKLSQTEAMPFSGKGSKPALKKAKPTDIITALYDEMEMVTPLTEAEQRLLSNLAVLPAENLSYDILKTLLTPMDAREFSRQLNGLAQRGWIEKSGRENPSFYKICPVVQEITRLKNKDNLLVYCEMLIVNLIEKLEYQPGTGHFLNATYEEAALFSRYAESLAAYFEGADYNLSLLFDRLGYYHKTVGDLNKALRYFEDYSRLSREFLNSDPENEVYKDGLAISCERLGITHSSRGDLEQTLGYFQECQSLEKELYEAYPGNVAFKNGLAVAYQWLG